MIGLSQDGVSGGKGDEAVESRSAFQSPDKGYTFLEEVLRFLPASMLTLRTRLISDSRTADSYMLTTAPILLDGHRLLCTNTYSAMTCSRCTCVVSLWLCLLVPMYISALLCAKGTPSEFSSVPILVADELVQSSSCEPRF